MQKLNQETINGLQGEYRYGLNTSVISTRSIGREWFRLVVYLSVRREASRVRLSIGVNQDEITVEDTSTRLGEEDTGLYLALSHILNLMILQSSGNTRKRIVSIRNCLLHRK